jgi:hypothetical protein
VIAILDTRTLDQKNHTYELEFPSKVTILGKKTQVLNIVVDSVDPKPSVAGLVCRFLTSSLHSLLASAHYNYQFLDWIELAPIPSDSQGTTGADLAERDDNLVGQYRVEKITDVTNHVPRGIWKIMSGEAVPRAPDNIETLDTRLKAAGRYNHLA